MDFRGSGGGGGGGGNKKRQSGSGGGNNNQQKSSASSSSRYNVTPPSSQAAAQAQQDQMNQLLLQQYFMQEQERSAGGGGSGGNNSMAAAQAAAAAALFGGMLGGGGGGGDKMGGMGALAGLMQAAGGGSSSREQQQQLQELFAAAAVAQQQQQAQAQSSNNNNNRSSSNTPSPSPRNSSPHTNTQQQQQQHRNSQRAEQQREQQQSAAATAAALQQLTAASVAAALQQQGGGGGGGKKDSSAAAAQLAAQQQWMYLDYLQRIQQDVQAQAALASAAAVHQQQQQQVQQQQQQSKGRGRSSSLNKQQQMQQQQQQRGSKQQHQTPPPPPPPQLQRMQQQNKQGSNSNRNSSSSSDLTRLFEQYTQQSQQPNTNSLLKSSVLASAKLPADTEIIVQKNTRGSSGGNNSSSAANANSAMLQQLQKQLQSGSPHQQQHSLLGLQQQLMQQQLTAAAAASASTPPVHNKRGPKPKQQPQHHGLQQQQQQQQPQSLISSSTITSEQAKFEQQLINLGNNNAITITPANLDMKQQTTAIPIATAATATSTTPGGGPAPPITITPANTGSSSSTPPPAHSTPFRYGNDKRDAPPMKVSEDVVAHKYVKELYTHVIPRRPQIGLIGGPSSSGSGSNGRVSNSNNKGGNKKGLLSAAAAAAAQFRHHRPWIIEQNDMLITASSSSSTPPPLNLNTTKDNKSDNKLTNSKFLNIPKPAPEPIIISPPDYSIPIKEGWKREMILKTFDLNEENLSLACEVTYISPEGKVFSSLNEVKKSNVGIEAKNFTFNSKIQLGRFVLPVTENCGKRFEFDELVEHFRERKLEEIVRKRELRMRHEHSGYVRLIEAFRKNKRKLKMSSCGVLKRFGEGNDLIGVGGGWMGTPKSQEVEELKDENVRKLPRLQTIDGKKLNDKTFANLLQIHEFLHTFGETLGFDSESLPSLGSLQKAFLNVEDNEEELVSVLCHLLVCAVEDPGLPNPTGVKHLTPFGQTLKQADVTFGSMSEILRIYLYGISDSEPEAEEFAGWLEVAPFTAQSAYRKSVVVAFICDLLLQNKAVLRYLENCSELIHNCKKEKQQNEIRVRKLRMLVARKQIVVEVGGGNNNSGSGGEEGGNGEEGGAGEKKDEEADGEETKKVDEEVVGADGENSKSEQESKMAVVEELVSAGEDSMMQGDDGDQSMNSSMNNTNNNKSTPPPPNTKDPAYAAVASVADSISSDPDSKLTIEELNSKMASLGSVNEKLKRQMQSNSKSIRSTCLGQDRYRRRYWNLHFGGGVYVEGGATGEFEEVRNSVREKFEKNPELIESCMEVDEEVVVAVVAEEKKVDVSSGNGSNGATTTTTTVSTTDAEAPAAPDEVVVKKEPEDGVVDIKEEKDVTIATPPPPPTTATDTTKPHKTSSLFTVPPPVIKIFSFAPRPACSGKSIHPEDSDAKLTDDELLVKHIRGGEWFDWKCIPNEEELTGLVGKLCEKGIREKGLKNALNGIAVAVANAKNAANGKNAAVPLGIPELRDDELDSVTINPSNSNDDDDEGFVDPELLYKIHLGLIETLETLEERVASASLQVKGWVLPSRNLMNENLSEEAIIEIVKERVLDLENAVERRYLKPPLGKSGLEVNLTQLLKESEDVSYNMLLDGPIGSTSSTRGQQINENNKLKMELKERERLEKELAARKEKEEGGGGKGESRFLNHWREAIAKTTSPSVLSMAIYILDSSIAWDKSVMKASCQLCKGGDNEDKLLLCDACDRGYHTYCFKPPLENIPDGDWFCWECINKATGNKCCIVCGKGQIPNVKLLCCDKCVKAYHQDCIVPPVGKAPRGRWFCPDHRDEGGKGSNKVFTLSQAISVSSLMNSSTGGGTANLSGGEEKTTPSNSNNGGSTSSSKKASPKKKGGTARNSNTTTVIPDGNVSDSSNSSSFIGLHHHHHHHGQAGNTTPISAAAMATNSSQESDGGMEVGNTTPKGRSSTPVTSSASKKESGGSSSKKKKSLSKKKGTKSKKKVEAPVVVKAATEEEEEEIEDEEPEAAAVAVPAVDDDEEDNTTAAATPTKSGSHSNSNSDAEKNNNSDCGGGGGGGSPEKESSSSTGKSTPKVNVNSKKFKTEMAWCEKLLDDLVGHEDAWPFLEPVNTRQFPTYKKIIKTPMDLQTIRTRLLTTTPQPIYKNKDAFLQDVRLIFDNCETFNEDDSPVGKAGHTLRLFFEGKSGVVVGGGSAAGSSSSGGGGK